jgi:AraC family transcriptional regulator
LVEGLSLAIAADLSTVLRGVQPRVHSDGGKLSVQQLKKIKDYIESLEGDAPTVAGIAELVGMSSRHLMRVFKHTTNMTVYEFITRQRMRRARSMLMETKLLIKEISHRLGFATIESFSSSFRAATGESPLAFRRRVLSGGRPLRLDA